MTKKERDEGNEIIARFAGKLLPMCSLNDFKESPLPDFMLKRLKFHCDWNELIRACRKFDRLSESFNLTSYQWSDYESLCDNIDDMVICFEIQPVFTNLVKAIKWRKGQSFKSK